MGFVAARYDLPYICTFEANSALGLAIVDVTNPAARQWYTDKLKALLDLGVDSFKVWTPLPFITHTNVMVI